MLRCQPTARPLGAYDCFSFARITVAPESTSQTQDPAQSCTAGHSLVSRGRPAGLVSPRYSEETGAGRIRSIGAINRIAIAMHTGNSDHLGHAPRRAKGRAAAAAAAVCARARVPIEIPPHFETEFPNSRFVWKQNRNLAAVPPDATPRGGGGADGAPPGPSLLHSRARARARVRALIGVVVTRRISPCLGYPAAGAAAVPSARTQAYRKCAVTVSATFTVPPPGRAHLPERAERGAVCRGPAARPAAADGRERAARALRGRAALQ
eukprot:gene750-biopygen7660